MQLAWLIETHCQTTYPRGVGELLVSSCFQTLEAVHLELSDGLLQTLAHGKKLRKGEFGQGEVRCNRESRQFFHDRMTTQNDCVFDTQKKKIYTFFPRLFHCDSALLAQLVRAWC